MLRRQPTHRIEILLISRGAWVPPFGSYGLVGSTVLAKRAIRAGPLLRVELGNVMMLYRIGQSGTSRRQTTLEEAQQLQDENEESDVTGAVRAVDSYGDVRGKHDVHVGSYLVLGRAPHFALA